MWGQVGASRVGWGQVGSARFRKNKVRDGWGVRKEVGENEACIAVSRLCMSYTFL